MSNPRIDKLERNLLMNGGFSLFQRAGASVAVNTSTSLAYSAPDRWRVKHAGTFTGTPNVVRDTVVPNNSYPHSLKHAFQRNAAAAVLNYEQRVESVFSSEILDIGKASFSVYVRPDIAGTVVITFYTPTVLDNHTAQNTVYTSSGIAVTASSWQLIQLPNITLSSGVDLGLAVNIQYTSASGTDGAAVNFRLTRAMLNLGTKCIPFQRHGGSPINELNACTRYYEKSYFQDEVPGTLTVLGGHVWHGQNVSNRPFTTIYFKQEKRSTPTISTYNPQVANSNIRDTDAGADFAPNLGRTNSKSFGINPTGTPNTTAVLQVHWAAESEL